MTEPREPRRPEKQDEKEEEKRQEKQEKSSEEKWRRDPLTGLTWALVLIWGGLVLLAETTGFSNNFSWWGGWAHGWAVFLIGWGLIILAVIGYRLLRPEYRRPVTGNLILAIVLIAIGLGDIISWNVFWPLVLILIGVIILLRVMMRRK